MNIADYEKAMKNKYFKEVLPETYKAIEEYLTGDTEYLTHGMVDILENKEEWVNNHIESFDYEQEYYNLESELEKYDLAEAMEAAWYNSGLGLPLEIENNDDFKQFLKEYLNENYENFLNKDGTLKWNDLLKYIPFKYDIFLPICLNVANGEKCADIKSKCIESLLNDFEKHYSLERDIDDFINRLESKFGKDTHDQQSNDLEL